jgi:nucleotide-binding universal stress UspA family protein
MFASIVVGTDGSDTATKAVVSSAEVAKGLGAKLHIVSAYHPVAAHLHTQGDPEGADWNVDENVLVEGVLTEATAAIASFGVELETHAVRGDPAEALIEIAQETNAELIVVGSKGMTGARRFLLGNVPNKVSHHAHCSVLIVRTA